MPRQRVEITDDNGKRVASVIYDPEAKTLRFLELKSGKKTVRIWSPKLRDFRVAPMEDDEKTVDVKWL